MNVIAIFTRPFMVYGYWNAVQRRFHKLTRISSTVTILSKKNADIGEGCWVWHHSIIDATGHVKIGDYCQIGAWVGIFTHSSHLSVRMLGKDYIHQSATDRLGYVVKPVEIGAYSFIGAQAIILPGVKIGKGCLISAASVVYKDVPDFSIAKGNPAEVVGSVFDMDKKFIDTPDLQSSYFDWHALKKHLET